MKFYLKQGSYNLLSLFQQIEASQDRDIIFFVQNQFDESCLDFALIRSKAQALGKRVRFILASSDEGFDQTSQEKEITQEPIVVKAASFIGRHDAESFEDPEHTTMADIIKQPSRQASSPSESTYRDETAQPLDKTIPLNIVPEEEEKEAHLPFQNQRRFSRRTLYLTASFFLATALMVAFFVVTFVLPKATIAVDIKSEDLDLTVPLKISSLSKNIIPSESFISIEGELIKVEKVTSRVFPATDLRDIKEKAKGIIKITNLWDSQPQTLVKDTRFLSEQNLIYRSLKSIVVPGATLKEGKLIAGAIDVEIEASEPGEDFNITSTVFTIPAFKEYGRLDKYEKIRAETKTPIAGGSKRKAKVVSEDDINKAKETLLGSVREGSFKDLESRAPKNLEILKDGALEMTDFTFKKGGLGEIIDNFELNLKYTLYAMLFSKDSLLNAARDHLMSKIKKQGSVSLSNVFFEYKHAKFDLNEKTLGIELRVKGQAKVLVDKIQLLDSLAGKPDSDVKSVLDDFPEIEKIEVHLWPFWVDKIPKNKSRIDVILD